MQRLSGRVFLGELGDIEAASEDHVRERSPRSRRGDLVYLPRKPAGDPDKRQGNRWSVIDAELRPIVERYFVWWGRVVVCEARESP